jgi:predicted PurR-regulated permease PerM
MTIGHDADDGSGAPEAAGTAPGTDAVNDATDGGATDDGTAVRDAVGPDGLGHDAVAGGWHRLWRSPRLNRPVVQPLRRAVGTARAHRPRRPVQIGIPTLDELLAGAQPEAHPVPPAAPASERRDEEQDADQHEDSRFGHPGRAFNRSHPFYIGFIGALGVLTAYALVQLIGQLTQVITLLVVSLFLALGLEPVVEWLQNRGLPRTGAIIIVFAGVVAVVAGFVSAIIPIIVSQATELIAEIPEFIADIQSSKWFTDLDARYDVVGRITEEVQNFFSGDRFTVLFGGVFGAGKAVVSGLFSTLTVLVLTLYFLASLRHIKSAAYHLVPRSRRHRVQLLGDEISRRIGGYVIGQITIATINAACSYVMMLIVGLPYALVLAAIVGVFGLIPLVGATLGAIVVATVALFSSTTDAVIVGIYYIAYQQFENYVIVPRIMQRTVAVPGALAIIAALAGGSLFGVLGALIAIPLAAGVLLVVQEVLMPRQDRA